MHPDLRHDGRAVGAARLRDLVLMMRKDEVDAAAMDVEGLAEMRRRHGRAFDMPAGAPRRRDAAGDGHDGSPGFDGFHSTKSIGSCLNGATSTRAPAIISSSERPESLP